VKLRILVVAALLLAVPPAVLAAELNIENTRAAGFSDPTPATPLGVNPGTTRGDQALIVFQTAAAMWGATVRSTVPILIDSQFDSVTTNSEFQCTSQGTVLAYTQPTGYFSSNSYPNPNAGYPIPLANALLGTYTSTATESQFQVNINADLGTSKCDFPAAWYFGLDTQIPQDGISLLTTLLHEFGHGLGFSSLVNPSTGQGAPPLSIFDFHIWDVADDAAWVTRSTAERKQLVTTPNSLAFQGPAVQADIPTYLAAPPTLFTTFNSVTTDLNFSQGEFSGPLSGTGQLVAAVPLDACSSLSNSNEVQGKFALIERSLADAGVVCTFLSKAERAADAGAIGVIIYDSVPEGLIDMSGTPALNIPATFISNTDGTTLQTQLASGTVTAGFGTSTQISNTDPTGKMVLLYTPSTLKAGSSLIHWNNNSYPHTLMLEFANQADIRLNMDFTPDVMSDLGWSVVYGLGVSVVKLLDQEVPAGAQFPYLIAVINRRPTSIANVQVDLALPPGTTLVSTVSSPAGCLGFPCSVGTMQAGEVLLIVATVQAPLNATAPFVATATLTPSSSDSSDNLTATSTQAVASGGDVQVTVTGPTTLTAGSSATLTTTVTNAGPGDAASVAVNGTITGASASPPVLTANAGGCINSEFPCYFGTLAKGQTVSFTSTFTIPTNFQSGATFTASATSITPDSNAANNTASFTFLVGTSGSGGGGCSSSGEPAALFGLFGLALAIVLRKRHTF
jgi:MYXO-CTERM domain-containing protein